MSGPTRRSFLRRLGVVTGAGVLSPGLAAAKLAGVEAGSGWGPLIRDGSAVRPIVISSANGLRATDRAFRVLEAGGDTLEAIVSGVNIVEADPDDMSVGYGGLPNADGVVQLDSQVYHGPTRGVGAVAALEGFALPSRVAVAVMRYTDHVLLVGRGAARFAREMGFEETDLLTDRARRRWIEWRSRLSDRDDYLAPSQSGEPVTGFQDPGGPGAVDGDADVQGFINSADGGRPTGTIHCSAVDANGDLSAVTTTSGLAFKVPGRVGDSPLPGCGCYADNDVGAAGSTGRGEAVIKTVGAYLIVEEMRRGAHPTDACLTALRRIVGWTVEKRLLDEAGRPAFNVNYYALDKKGETGAASLYSGARYSVNDGRENRSSDIAFLFQRG